MILHIPALTLTVQHDFTLLEADRDILDQLRGHACGTLEEVDEEYATFALWCRTKFGLYNDAGVLSRSRIHFRGPFLQQIFLHRVFPASSWLSRSLTIISVLLARGTLCHILRTLVLTNTFDPAGIAGSQDWRSIRPATAQHTPV